MESKIAVLGAGSWGTALARLLARKGLDITLWAYEPEVVESINGSHKNPIFLTEVELPENLKATNNLSEALKDKEFVVSVIPTPFMRRVWSEAASLLSPDTILVSCSKGIEVDTQKLPSEIFAECLPDYKKGKHVCLSGPSFAKEVANDLPTSVTIAGTDKEVAKKVQELFRTETFLTFTHDDIIGAEIGGAIKNVLAIATGISDGLGFGNNARAAIITRGLYEMIKIGQSKGAKPVTFMGLAGIGDLVLTATDALSRNYSLGKRVGEGEKIEDIISGMTMVAEGYKTSVAVHEYTAQNRVNAPICETVFRILYESYSPREAALDLCTVGFAEELRAVQM